ncbi:hypothetical protein GCM10008018_60480 [Paenibacillus marchantiophytorum]|uniref:Uncharacterized protein n=1 Tax=Paenibacillus marchantiophytorum TaxID=1619310 RepID=A0ABQ1FC31_9BACL|nr:hypothetical protein GCM10008018_60480 [Paenibacillus marchantiophytorum]
MKSIPHRIQYYTRKAAQYSALRRSTSRYGRLLTYKAALNIHIKSERGRAL